MKKVLSLLCLGISVGLSAQTMLLNDFESGLGDAYVAWGGTCEVIDNPNKNGGVNNSDKILKISTEDFAPVGFPVTLPAGKTLNDYTGIRFHAALLEIVDGSPIHWVGFNVGVSQDKESMDLVDPVGGNGAAWQEGIVNNWVDVELLFNEQTLAEVTAAYESGQYNVMIKLGREKFIYGVDNIRLIEKEQLSDPNTIFTFETMDLGPSSRCGMPWSGTCEVVANPYQTSDNNSGKVLKIFNKEYSPLTLAN